MSYLDKAGDDERKSRGRKIIGVGIALAVIAIFVLGVHDDIARIATQTFNSLFG